MGLLKLVHSDVEPRSHQKIQEFRTPTRKLRNSEFVPGNSGIQDFPRSQTLGRKISQTKIINVL